MGWFRRHDEALALREQGLSNAQIANKLGTKPVTIWRALGPEGRRYAGGRTNKVRQALCRSLSERELRAMASAIDGTYYPPARADTALPAPVAPRPCVRCGVKYADHAAHGCKNYKPPA